MLARAATFLVCLAMLCGCGESAAPPTATTLVSVPAATATPAVSATPTTPVESVAATPPATAIATSDPIVGYEKLQEGPHGGPPVVELPAQIVIYYAVKGRCTFSIEIHRADATGRLEARKSTDVNGEASGAWQVELQPTSYYVAPSESVGCTYTVNVYPA